MYVSRWQQLLWSDAPSLSRCAERSEDVEEEEQDGVVKEGGEGRRRLLVDECPQLAAEEAEL